MNLYINDKYIHILKPNQTHFRKFDMEVSNLKTEKPESLVGVVFISNAEENDILLILNWLEFKKLGKLDSIIFQAEDYEATKEFVKKQFRIIKAAGGLVRKKDKFLMIYRLGKWDLPKGKLEKDEKTREAAVREVNEECGVEVEIVDKLVTTWHSYIQEGKRILKKSTWYNMNCLDDSNMEPQYIENIEDIRWMSLEEVNKALKNSYRSISGVIEAWTRQNENLDSTILHP
jgi:ADP-ribose pyrophosphatase YjhB (NUDIX family)